MSEETSVQVNFGKPMPLFALDAVNLLPQQVLPLHIFEPRYRQMLDHALDGAGQIAMCIFAGDDWKRKYHGRPALRRACCVGQIVQHEKLPDGRYNILLQGVCRARIRREGAADVERLYRVGYLEPVGLEMVDSEELQPIRVRIADLLTHARVREFQSAKAVLEWVQNDEIPTQVLIELISFAMISDAKLKYKLLAEASPFTRGELVVHELEALDTLVRKARSQRPDLWPKGCSWN